MSLPSAEKLQEAWENLQKIHKRYLDMHGVIIPDAVRYSENNKAAWLAILWYYQDQEVDKNKISRIVMRDIEDAGADQQVRHLKRDGWDIGKKRGVHCLNPYRPSHEFEIASAQRRARLEAGDFDDIKKAFGYCCATCGANEGRPDPRYGGENVILQSGHMDPSKPGNDKMNIIPQCQFCNRTYKADYVFDEKGRVHAVADVPPVRRASRPVQQKIFEWLKDHLKFNKPPR